MPGATDSGYVAQTTLSAGVATALTTLKLGNSRRATIVIHNNGGNTIGTVLVEKSADGSVWATDAALGTAIGSIASGAKSLVELTDIAFAELRLTLTSASGSTAIVYYRGT